MKTGIIEEIKDKVSCISYMEREHQSRISGGRCRSFRADATNNSSLMVNDRDWYDFGSGKGGDVIDLAAIDKFSGDKGAAIRYLADQWGVKNAAIPANIQIVFSSYLAIIDAATDFYHTQLGEKQRTYLHGRGLTDETIDALRIGWATNPCEYLKGKGFTQDQIADSGVLGFVNRTMIPYTRNGKAVYLIGRASEWKDFPSSHPDAKYMKMHRNEYSEHPIWGAESLRRTGDVIIAEGIFDAISCYQEGYAVVTAVTGAFSSEQKKDLIPMLKGRNVIVCMDYDPETKAGQKFTTTLAAELFDAGIRVSACYLQGDAEKVDLSMLYAADPCRQTIARALSTAKPWEKVRIVEIGKLPENEKRAQLTSFLRNCVKRFDWPTVAQMIADASTLTDDDENPVFAPEWLKELKKSLQKPPAELAIVDEFKKKYDVVYHEQLGWYEYNTTYWERKSEFEVRQYIAELYGSYRTARNVDSVYRLLRAELIRKELFDENKELLNCPNGMLNVETGEITPHSRDYFSSIQMSYAYDPKAEAPEWRKFLDDITAGDLQRHNVLQEMFGYCLTKDARYQKCFCLIGTGANGKSVLLNILEAMVGKANTSHVEVAFLNSDFQRIGLLSSMVNICNDIKSDVSGTEAFLKSIVAGDPITACYKGKDFVNFHPYCKMVFSSNRMLTAKEVDYSYLRRICFINFPITFVDREPDNAMEKRRDPTIEERLLQELPGILNWALTGLRELRKNKCFTTTTDQTQRERDMLTINNPLISFVEDVIQEYHWTGARSRMDVYKEYDKWCQSTNSSPMSARSFWPRLRLIAPYRETRTATGRFIEFFDTESKKSLI